MTRQKMPTSLLVLACLTLAGCTGSRELDQPSAPPIVPADMLHALKAPTDPAVLTPALPPIDDGSTGDDAAGDDAAGDDAAEGTEPAEGADPPADPPIEPAAPDAAAPDAAAPPPAGDATE